MSGDNVLGLSPPCCCDICTIFVGGDGLSFFAPHFSKIQVSVTGNVPSGTVGDCCTAWNYLSTGSSGGFAPAASPPGANRFPFTITDFCMWVQYTKLIANGCTVSPGFMNGTRTHTVTFLKRLSDGHIWMSGEVFVGAVLTPTGISSARWGAIDLGTSPLDASGGPWSIDLAGTYSGGFTTVATCWDTPGTLSVAWVP